MTSLEREIREHLERDTFGGYDWGNPVEFRPRPEPRRVFVPTIEQLALAERLAEGESCL